MIIRVLVVIAIILICSHYAYLYGVYVGMTEMAQLISYGLTKCVDVMDKIL